MSDVPDEMMAATYEALCECGYADLTMQDIADRTDKSKAALHYYYDSKRDLLLAFLDYLYEEFTERVADPEGETEAERLAAFIELVLTPPDEDRVDEAFATAILELKAQAPYDDGVRERLRRFDEFLADRIRARVEAGIEAGEFREVDPDDVARFLVTSMDGARTKQVAVGRDVACTRRLLQQYVDRHLTSEGGCAAGERVTSE
jgi:AcrR family transcriptional regulator